MRLLLDAHALIWYVDQDHLLSRRAHAAITSPSNDLIVSAGTIWEIAIKVGLRKLSLIRDRSQRTSSRSGEPTAPLNTPAAHSGRAARPLTSPL